MDKQNITIEVTEDKVLELLQNLQKLNLLKILNNEKTEAEPKKLSSYLEGSLSDEKAEEMLNHLQESRNEWDRPTSQTATLSSTS